MTFRAVLVVAVALTMGCTIETAVEDSAPADADAGAAELPPPPPPIWEAGKAGFPAGCSPVVRDGGLVPFEALCQGPEIVPKGCL